MNLAIFHHRLVWTRSAASCFAASWTGTTVILQDNPRAYER